MSARRLATLGGFSAFQQVVSWPPHERQSLLPLAAVRHVQLSRAGEGEAESEGLKGPKRAEVLTSEGEA
jgi:hypothetical protein